MGYTQRAIAELVGVSPQAVGQWERDEAVPTYANLKKISAVLAGEKPESLSDMRAVVEAQQLVLAALAAQVAEQSDELDEIVARLAAVEVVLGQRRES